MSLAASLEIARKEFLEHVLSWRFLIALVLSTLILVTSFLALAAAYREDLDAFASRQADLEQDDGSFSKVLVQINRHLARPNLLSIFVGGAGDDYRSRALSGGGQDGPGSAGGGSQPESGMNSPTNRRFTPLDLGFVAVVVMTFMAVMFSFDAVSGEKERGTLKLMLANPVPKDAVLLGKYLGGMASVSLPFLLSLVIGLAVLAGSGVTLRGGEWLRLGAILGAFVLLLSAFYLMGLLVSSLTRRSGTSLLALTLVWFVLVFGVGNLAGVAAKTTTDTVSTAEVQTQYAEIGDRAFNRFQEIGEELFPLLNRGGNLTAEEQARMTELQNEQSQVFDEAADERNRIREDASRKLDDQLSRAEAVAAFSPAEAFRSLSGSIARSDYWSFRDVSEAALEYQREVDRARQEWEEDNPASGGGPRGRFVVFGAGGARTIGEDGFEPPEFQYQPASLGERLSSASGVRDALVLLGYNLAAFLGAYLAFLRYDVR